MSSAHNVVLDILYPPNNKPPSTRHRFQMPQHYLKPEIFIHLVHTFHPFPKQTLNRRHLSANGAKQINIRLNSALNIFLFPTQQNE